MINTPKSPFSHEDRHLACQEEVDGPLREILDQATAHGWNTVETISAMEAVLTHLRHAYTDDPDPAEEMDEIDPRPSADPDPSNDWPGAKP